MNAFSVSDTANRLKASQENRLATFIADHEGEVTESNCQDACAHWVRLLRPAGFSVEWVGGFVNGDIGHAWLEVDGVLFDPTAAQYGGDQAEYDETERFESDELDGNGWPL
jgi:hypothetical protein